MEVHGGDGVHDGRDTDTKHIKDMGVVDEIQYYIAIT